MATTVAATVTGDFATQAGTATFSLAASGVLASVDSDVAASDWLAAASADGANRVEGFAGMLTETDDAGVGLADGSASAAAGVGDLCHTCTLQRPAW